MKRKPLRTWGFKPFYFSEFPTKKTKQASGAYAENGIVQKALRAIKSKCPDLVAITDVCLCEYMSHGHCGVIRIDGDRFRSSAIAVRIKWILPTQRKPCVR